MTDENVEKFTMGELSSEQQEILLRHSAGEFDDKPAGESNPDLSDAMKDRIKANEKARTASQAQFDASIQSEIQQEKLSKLIAARLENAREQSTFGSISQMQATKIIHEAEVEFYGSGD